MADIVLKKTIGNRVLNGHPWIYGTEVEKITGEVKPGEICSVFTAQRNFIGKAYVNPQSQIVARMLTRDKHEEIDRQFFARRLQTAWNYRQRLGYTENCRLIFGEADGLPQTIIDKFNDYFVIQTLTAGMDRWKHVLAEIITEMFSPKGIFERNDVPVRKLEGLEEVKGFLSHPFDTRIVITENGVSFYVDVENGQKTGYFLDQQDNRQAIKAIVKDSDVLGVFTYTGSFELHAAHYGARSVRGIDISQAAVEQASQNAFLNGYQHICKFECANAFDRLKELTQQQAKFDVVMLDPPSFTKTRSHLDKAIAGYKEINLRGIKLVRPGGFLVTSSCTHLISQETFLSTVQAAAHDAKRIVRQVTFNTQSADHPIVWGWENTYYLKFLILQVL